MAMRIIDKYLKLQTNYPIDEFMPLQPKVKQYG
jgi:hypothetical protein